MHINGAKKVSTVKTVYLSLGSNLGNRENYLKNALAEISKEAEFEKCSSIWETPAWGYTDEQLYLNIACAFKTEMMPLEFFIFLESVERQLGRNKKTIAPLKYSAREIDIDILFFGEESYCTPELSIPHPRLHLRNFVLAPLCEIAPDFVHPEIEETIKTLYDRSPDPARATRLNYGL